MKSKRHYQPSPGDVFFIPYDRDLVYDEKTNYHPRETDKGIIAQVIQRSRLGLTLAFLKEK